MRFVLFDIDGTLIDSGGAGVRALNLSFEEEYRIDNAFSGISMAGKTDLQIIKEALRKFGIPDSNGALPRLTEGYLGRLSEEIDNDRRHVKPGVVALLDALSDIEDVYMGLLTGNFEAGARIKLEVFGLNKYFPIGAYGSDSEDRNRLLPLAVERFKSSYGRELRYRDCVVIGDTPRDVFSAKPYGAMSIATATGPYPADALRMAKADLVLSDLSDMESVVGFISGR